MKKYLLIMTILCGQSAFAAGNDTGFLFGGDASAVEAPAKVEPAPAKPAVTTEQPVEVKPAVDKLADVRCSANKYTELATGSGPNANDAEDIVIAIMGISNPLNRVVVQTTNIDPKKGPSKFGISHREGRLQIGLPGAGFLGGTVWLPAKMCVTDNNHVMAYINGSSVGMGGAIPVEMTNLGGGSMSLAGSSDGNSPLQGNFKVTDQALR